MADIFDDDEENPPIGFEQDPDEDEIGIGTWKYADGSTKYSKGDAEDAKALLKKAPLASAGAALAGGDFAGEKKPSATRADAGTAAAALGGERSPEEAFLASTTGAEADEPGVGSTEEAFRRARSGEAPKAIGGASPEPAGAPAAQPAPQGQPLQAPRLPGASGPARYTDTTGASASQSQSANTQSSTSTTKSAQDEGQFNEQQGNIAESYAGQKQAQDEGSAGVVDAIQERRNQLMQLAQDREAATVAAQSQRDARANQVKQKIGEVSARKTDHNKIWKDKGAFGTTLGLLGVALRSLTATKFGGPNTALQSIQEQKKQNLQAQMEDRDSELRGLERELGSLDAAVPMLEARMNDALGKRLEAMTLNEKSAQVLANAKTMKAQLDTERDQKLAEAAKAYYGTVAQQQSVESGRSRLSGAGVGGEGGPKRMTPREIAEADQAWEEQGVPLEQRARLWVENGYEAPTDKTAAQYKREREGAESDAKRTEQEGKAQAAAETMSSFGKAAGLERDQKTGEWVVGKGAAPPGFWESVNPFSDDSIKANAEAAVEAYGRLQSGGVIGDEERQAFRDQLGLNTGNRQQLAARLNAAEKTIRARQPVPERKRGTSAPDAWRGEPREARP